MLMIADGKVLPIVRFVGSARDIYEVDERVVFLAHINNPQIYAPGDRIIGTVIARFQNPDEENMTYRIRLDLIYPDSVMSKPTGEPVVVGNVSNLFMLRIA